MLQIRHNCVCASTWDPTPNFRGISFWEKPNVHYLKQLVLSCRLVSSVRIALVIKVQFILPRVAQRDEQLRPHPNQLAPHLDGGAS